MLLRNGFELIRSKGSHRIYAKGKKTIVIPFHAARTLHPKVVKRVIESLDLKKT